MRITEIRQGKLEGVACGWPSITAYYGIPYAAAPVGELRWRAPGPAPSWEGVRDCARPSCICPQPPVGGMYKKEFYPYVEEQSEDCLYLNIWTPAESIEDRLPVIVWIHGGAFMTGYGHSAHFDGEPFARKGVILVTINYRLNIFGWMTHPELDAESESGTSGNYGLLDQIAALKWVRDNISAFGGDPSNVTVAGQSAGAMSVQALLMSPLSQGLCVRAIMQSGGGLSELKDMQFGTLAEAEEATDLSVLGVETIEEARKIPADKLFELFITHIREEKIRRQPVIDGYVLPADFTELADQGRYNKVPCIIGSNADDDAAPGFNEAVKNAAADWGRRNPGSYVYYMTRRLPGDEAGAFHAADLWYVFRTLDRSWRPWEGGDYVLADQWNSYWCNFARTGNPNGPGLPEWEVYKNTNIKYMNI